MNNTTFLDSLKELISPKTKKRLRRIFSKNEPVPNYTLRPCKWLTKRIQPLYPNYKAASPHEYSTNIPELDPLVGASVARDQYIDKLINSKKYTFEYPIVFQNPFACAPLTALVGFVTKTPCKIRCTVPSDEGAKDIVNTYDEATIHRIPVIGLYPDRVNTITLELLNGEEVVSSQEIQIKTKRLPRCLNDAVTIEKHTKPSGFPFTFVTGGSTDYSYAFDENGDVRYYIKRTTKVYGLFFLSNGRFLHQSRFVLEPTFSNPHPALLNEMDFLGRTHRTYFVPNGTHHDICEMTPGGNFLAAYSTLYNSTEDSVVEIDRQTGEVVKIVDVGLLLDPVRRTYKDWIHVNTVSYDEKRNTVLINSRNLHTALEIDWDTEEVNWVLGHPDFWKDTTTEEDLLAFEKPDMPWFFQAHATYFIDEDLDGNPDTRHLITFDNHWQKRTPVPFFDEERAGSYAKIYYINDQKRTVSFVKEFESLKSAIRSNAIYDHEHKRVFIMSAYLIETTKNGRDGMIYEYDYDSGELLNQYGTFHSFYRAYNFAPNMQALTLPMDHETRVYEFGDAHQPKELKNVYFSSVEKLPRPSVEEFEDDMADGENNEEEKPTGPIRHKRKEMIIKKYKDEGRTNELTKEELQSHLEQITIRRRGNHLYVRSKDHLLTHVYLVGTNHYYDQDYTNTYQALPEVFGDHYYNKLLPLTKLKKDSYVIYVETEDVIYETPWHIKLS